MAGNEPIRLNVGAGRIRQIIVGLPVSKRAAFVQQIWPDLDEAVAALIALHPEETRVNGGCLSLPASWASVAPKRKR